MQNIEELFEQIKPNLIGIESKIGPIAVYKNDSHVGLSIRLYGEYSHAEIDIMSSYLTPESMYVDIGTNVGYHARAVCLQAKCPVTAFEPHPKHFAVAAYNCKDLPIKVINSAVGNKNGHITLTDFDESKPANYGEVKVDKDAEISVPLMKIDELKLENCTVMKIDTEGQELNVLKGAAKTIKKFRPVIFYEANGETDWLGAYDFLDSKDYLQYWVGVRVKPVKSNFFNNEENPFGKQGVSNILAVPKELDQPDYLVPTEGHTPYNVIVDRLGKYKLVF